MSNIEIPHTVPIVTISFHFPLSLATTVVPDVNVSLFIEDDRDSVDEAIVSVLKFSFWKFSVYLVTFIFLETGVCFDVSSSSFKVSVSSK